MNKEAQDQLNDLVKKLVPALVVFGIASVLLKYYG